jgi:hypothetical protein
VALEERGQLAIEEDGHAGRVQQGQQVTEVLGVRLEVERPRLAVPMTSRE